MPCQTVQRNSSQRSLPAFWREPVSPPWRRMPPRRADAKTARHCLSGPKGHVTGRRPLVLPLRSRDQAQLLVQPRREETSPRAPRRRTFSAPSKTAPPSARVAANPVPPLQSSRAQIDRRCARRITRRNRARGSSRTADRRRAACHIANSQRAVAPDALAPSSPVASRWPESSGVSPSGGPRLAAAEPPASPPADADRPAPQPATAPVALAAADASLEKRRPRCRCCC